MYNMVVSIVFTNQDNQNDGNINRLDRGSDRGEKGSKDFEGLPSPLSGTSIISVLL